MNQLMSLLLTLDSMKLATPSNIVSMDDVKILIATDQYTVASQHLYNNIHAYDFPDDDHRSQILKVIHNAVIDKGIAHKQDYFDSLFDLIHSNAELKPILKFHEFKDHGYQLNDPYNYDKFVKMGRSLNNKEFKNKELVIFYCAKILETHDEIQKLKSQYF